MDESSSTVECASRAHTYDNVTSKLRLIELNFIDPRGEGSNTHPLTRCLAVDSFNWGLMLAHHHVVSLLIGWFAFLRMGGIESSSLLNIVSLVTVQV